MKVSVIIPTYNEEKVIVDCLKSLSEQTYRDMEVVVVDDGSTDKTYDVLLEFRIKNLELRIFRQNHKGPGEARNLGAKYTQGNILVFVDADMVFDKKFIEMLTRPIRAGKALGTFSKMEHVFNKENIWSRCWNINKKLPTDKMHPKNYPDKQPVFRAILKKEFEKAGGFKPIGYIDDYTISENLGALAANAPGAIFYHRNPETLFEVYTQARWVGKSEYKKRKIRNEILMRVISIIRYSPPFTLLNGIYKSFKYGLPQFIIFKIVYDTAIEVSLLRSFLKEQLYK